MKETNPVGEHSDEKQSLPAIQGFSVLIIGLGIGWMAGLSVSPVIAGIITGLLSIVAGIVTGLQSFQNGKSLALLNTGKSIDARPAALLILGIAIAATLGIVARTYHVLEPYGNQSFRNHEESVQATQNKGSYSSLTHSTLQNQGVLFTSHANECSELLSYAQAGNDDAFVGELKRSSLPGAHELANQFADEPETLKKIVTALCKE